MKATAPRLMRWITALATALLVAQAVAQDPSALPTQKDKDSYAVAVDLARNLKRRGVQMETEAFVRGVRDVLAGQKLLMTEDEIRETLRKVQVQEKQKTILPQRALDPIADDNAAKGAAFLAENKVKSGVVCLPSGLQYKVLQAGDGQKPSETDTIECRFRGSLIDGRQFSGTEPGSEPAAFKVGDVIPGLKEALQLMPVGSKWQLFIPPQLAYGEQGAGRSKLGAKIGPNSTLIYELELIAIK